MDTKKDISTDSHIQTDSDYNIRNQLQSVKAFRSQEDILLTYIEREKNGFSIGITSEDGIILKSHFFETNCLRSAKVYVGRNNTIVYLTKEKDDRSNVARLYIANKYAPFDARFVAQLVGTKIERLEHNDHWIFYFCRQDDGDCAIHLIDLKDGSQYRPSIAHMHKNSVMTLVGNERESTRMVRVVRIFRTNYLTIYDPLGNVAEWTRQIPLKNLNEKTQKVFFLDSIGEMIVLGAKPKVDDREKNSGLSLILIRYDISLDMADFVMNRYLPRQSNIGFYNMSRDGIFTILVEDCVRWIDLNSVKNDTNTCDVVSNQFNTTEKHFEIHSSIDKDGKRWFFAWKFIQNEEGETIYVYPYTEETEISKFSFKKKNEQQKTGKVKICVLEGNIYLSYKTENGLAVYVQKFNSDRE